MPGSFDRGTLQVPTVDATDGVGTNVKELEDIYLHLVADGGVFSGSFQPQGTLDGTHWFNIGSAITSAGVPIAVDFTVAELRIHTTTKATTPAVVTALYAGRKRNL